MSFLVLPPEINSSLIYRGAGSAPMLAAATSWDGLAAELASAAQSFSSVTSGLAGQAWQGAASAAMLANAAHYAGYLTAAATQAQTAAAQAQAVASEFESTLAAMVHPAVVAANRNQLVQLVASNLFGENAPAIAAVESDYEQMWAQDVAAMVGYHGGVSAAAAQLSPLAAALPNLSAQVSGAVANSPVGSVLSSASSAVSSSPVGGLLGTVGQDVNAAVSQAEQKVINVINAPTELLLGRPLISTGSSGSGGSAATSNATGTVMTSTSATVPLTIVDGTEAVVNASVGSGSSVPLLVDTGSTGLVIPYKDAGGILGLLKLGFPSGIGMGGYSGGINYVYATYDTTVNFGGGLVTQSTPVDLELFAWPSSFQSLLSNGISSFSFPSFFAADGATGILGVGPNAGGPSTSIPTQAFANSSYDTGLLINEATSSPYLEFGANPLTPIATLSGSPVTDLNVTVGSTTHTNVPSIIDSGGVYGTIPSSVIGSAPTGTSITVSTPSGVDLYSYTYGASDSATAISSGLMNTGVLLFQNYPVYISYSPSGVGTTYID
jgi:PPE-repeat protein